ncbi:MAG: hypothetical protein ACE5JI_04565 [Acidobacteriota bacterium]
MALTIIYCADPGCDEILATAPGLGLTAGNLRHDAGGGVVHENGLRVEFPNATDDYKDHVALKAKYPKPTDGSGELLT